MTRDCVFALTLVLTAFLAPLGRAGDAEPLPEPPKPPPSAKLQPSPEPVPARGLPAPPEGQLTLGSIVSNTVELYPHVRVKDPTHVAPGALSVVVAVRDPNPCRKDAAGIVFVQACVPTCPMCRLHVNKYGTHLKLDYGKYKIHFHSRDGVVTVNYDH